MRCLLLELAEISTATHNMYHSHALERPSEQILPGFGIPQAQADASQEAASSACLHRHVQSPHNCRLPRSFKIQNQHSKGAQSTTMLTEPSLLQGCQGRRQEDDGGA